MSFNTVFSELSTCNLKKKYYQAVSLLVLAPLLLCLLLPAAGYPVALKYIVSCSEDNTQRRAALTNNPVRQLTVCFYEDKFLAVVFLGYSEFVVE